MSRKKEDIEPDDCVLLSQIKSSESLKRPDSILLQRAELMSLLRSFLELFGGTPSCTDWLEHDIDVGEAKPIKTHFYCVSPDKLSTCRKIILLYYPVQTGHPPVFWLGKLMGQ